MNEAWYVNVRLRDGRGGDWSESQGEVRKGVHCMVNKLRRAVTMKRRLHHPLSPLSPCRGCSDVPALPRCTSVFATRETEESQPCPCLCMCVCVVTTTEKLTKRRRS